MTDASYTAPASVVQCTPARDCRVQFRSARGECGRPARYSNVMSSGAIMPARAPPSIDMLQIVIRSSIVMLADRGAGVLETRDPSRRPRRSVASSARMTSFAVTPGARVPRCGPRTSSASAAGGTASQARVPTSLVPMPKASAPNAPCVDVWLSPQTMVIPGCVSPSSGPMTWTMPRRAIADPVQRDRRTPSRSARACAICSAASGSAERARRESVGMLWSTVATVRSGRRTAESALAKAENACGEVTSWTRWRSMYSSVGAPGSWATQWALPDLLEQRPCRPRSYSLLVLRHELAPSACARCWAASQRRFSASRYAITLPVMTSVLTARPLKSTPSNSTRTNASPTVSCPRLTDFSEYSVSFPTIPVIRSMARYAASTGPSPVAESTNRWSPCRSSTVAVGRTAVPVLTWRSSRWYASPRERVMVLEDGDELFVVHFLLLIRERAERLVGMLELLLRQVVPELRVPLLEGVASGMFPEDERAVLDPHRLRAS